jgi:glycosyltransferase involved in cell wall biosynthesis
MRRAEPRHDLRLYHATGQSPARAAAADDGYLEMTQAARKVLVIAGVFPPTPMAEGDHVLHLCRMLAERGLEVEVLTRKGSIGDADLPFRVHPIMSKWNWAELPRLLKFAKRSQPDVIFLYFIGFAYDLHPMVTFAPSILKRALPTVPVVTQITAPVGSMAMQHSLMTRLLRKAMATALEPTEIDYSYGTLLRDSDRVIVMAANHLTFLERIMPKLAAKSMLIPPPPLILMSPAVAESRASGRQALGLTESDFVFAYFGRLYRGKGLETLLRAFKIVQSRHPGVRLAIVGGEARAYDPRFPEDWRVEQLHDLARTLGIEESVIWTGEFPWDSDVGSRYLRAADVAVLPFDNGVDLNNSSFAAVAAHGLPTVTTRGADLDESFRDSENVLLCPPLDPAAMASAMERLLVSPEIRQRLHAGISELANEWFTWEASVDRTIAALNTVTTPAKRTVVETGSTGVGLLGGR